MFLDYLCSALTTFSIKFNDVYRKGEDIYIIYGEKMYLLETTEINKLDITQRVNCMFEDTYNALIQCFLNEPKNLSASELIYKEKLFSLMKELSNTKDQEIERDE